MMVLVMAVVCDGVSASVVKVMVVMAINKCLLVRSTLNVCRCTTVCFALFAGSLLQIFIGIEMFMGTLFKNCLPVPCYRNVSEVWLQKCLLVSC